ncbi:MAG: hypothetical protein HKN23_10485 [Verrucomicrobiales bacterium]|nr:hypothetical protein [Verrucomicrobiales bacterium]
MLRSLQKVLVTLALPIADRWVRRQERLILAEGRDLDAWEKEQATEIGIEDREKVRVLIVPEVPTPGSFVLRKLARFFRLSIESPPCGMALGHGIFVESSHATNPSLIVHELAHVAQYERLGGTREFLREYLNQCLSEGYWDAFLEREAREVAAKFARPPER